MIIQEHVSLKELGTFRVGGQARYFCRVKDIFELREAILFSKKNNLPFFILGEGSNILISDSGFGGVVIVLDFFGIEIEDQGNKSMIISRAGEHWDSLVGRAVLQKLHGIENLSAIPGTVGAAPVQNIGAYGAEIKNNLHSVEVFDADDMEVKNFSVTDCDFSYRESIFKKNKNLIVTKVLLLLDKASEVNISYKDLRAYFLERKIEKPSIEEVRNAIIHIRMNKLPDPLKIGTVGSFFKNPIISKEAYASLLKKYPELPHYEINQSLVKIPVAWLLDNVCGLKGVRKNHVGLYEGQPLALVNFGGATASEIKKFADEISAKIEILIGVPLLFEVCLVGKF